MRVGGDGGKAQSDRRISTLSSKKDYVDDGASYDRRGVVVAPGG